MTRRSLLTGGITAGALAIGAGAYRFAYDSSPHPAVSPYAFLDERDRAIVAAIAPVLLGIRGVLPYAVQGTDVAIAGLPPHVRAQIRALLTLLRFPPSRMLLAGVWHPWESASSQEIASFLQRWRTGKFLQLRAAYDALHQLIAAGWYGQDRAWPATGYPGPPAL